MSADRHPRSHADHLDGVVTNAVIVLDECRLALWAGVPAEQVFEAVLQGAGLKSEDFPLPMRMMIGPLLAQLSASVAERK